jgi:predicted RecB family nuclease
MATKTESYKGRFYHTPQGDFPSVTTILGAVGKPALIQWAANEERAFVMETAANLYEDIHGTPKMERVTFLSTMLTRLGKEKAHQRALAKAGAIGSQVHALIEWTLRAQLCEKPGPSPAITEKGMWAFSVFQKWAKSVSLKPILIEQTVWSATHGYAGTLDLLAEVEGKLTVIDWKTGKRVYPEAHLQNAAYRHALREMGHSDAEQGIIVRLPKDEKDPEPEAVKAGLMPDGSTMAESELLGVFLGIKATWEYSSRMDTYKPAEGPVGAE